MPVSTYVALNGREIREALINRLTFEINKLPYLREGNSFHNAHVEFGLVMTAHPADVPVPQKELEFTISKKDINEIEGALAQVEKAEELAEQIDKIQEFKTKLEELENQAHEM